MKVRIWGDEWYPVYFCHEQDEDDTYHPEFEVDEETLTRWREAAAAFGEAQAQMRELVDPSCPECEHPRSRHQKWSEARGWGCLTCHRCQHGLTPAIQAEVEAERAAIEAEEVARVAANLARQARMRATTAASRWVDDAPEEDERGRT